MARKKNREFHWDHSKKHLTQKGLFHPHFITGFWAHLVQPTPFCPVIFPPQKTYGEKRWGRRLAVADGGVLDLSPKIGIFGPFYGYPPGN